MRVIMKLEADTRERTCHLTGWPVHSFVRGRVRAGAVGRSARGGPGATRPDMRLADRGRGLAQPRLRPATRAASRRPTLRATKGITKSSAQTAHISTSMRPLKIM